MIIERYGLRERGTWSMENLGHLAQALGYLNNEPFAQAIQHFITETVERAQVTEFLPALAANYLRKVQPPLERIT